jgi:glutaminyl-tRNA synthetase
VQGTIHWVSAQYALDAEVRMYDRLFTVPNPGRTDEGKTFMEYLNPDSLQVLTACKIEPSLAGAAAGTHYQFERKGFFCVDPDSTPGHLVFNLTVPLRDTWAKIEAGRKGG